MNNDINKNININWFPGHMKKASNLIEEKSKFVDFFIYILDARAIKSSLNKYLLSKTNNKKIMYLISKIDLADDKENEKWQKELSKQKDIALLVNLNNQKSIDLILNKIDEMINEKKEKMISKGIKSFSIRTMVIGIPNVGKSTLINLLSKRCIAKAENKPGLTRNITWIKVNKNLEILDTPGVLLPKFNSSNDAIDLALIGTIKENVLPLDDLFDYLMDLLRNEYNDLFIKKYSFDLSKYDNNEFLIEFSKKRGYLLKNNQLDIERSKKIILNDFKNGKIGKITLEKV